MIYTKEPWEIRNGSTGPYIIAKDGNGNHVTVAQVFPRGIAGGETKGNALLIKAAPKMYQALKELEKDLITWTTGTERELIYAALAEIEGKEGENVSTMGNTK